MIKDFAKQCFKSLAIALTRFHAGRILHQQLIDAGMSISIPVDHGGVQMSFVSPNALARYRSESFSVKEPETLTWLESIVEGSVLWDIGANVGLYSIYAAKKRNARVFAFEPSVFNLELLARNIDNNQVHDLVTIVPIALSNVHGPNLFKMSTTAWGAAHSNFGGDFDQHGCKLNTIFQYQTFGTTIDDAVKLLGIPSPRYVKVDVDGIEHLILRGALQTLKAVESIIIEVDDNFSSQSFEVDHHLHQAGLRLLCKSDGDHFSQHNQCWVRDPI